MKNVLTATLVLSAAFAAITAFSAPNAPVYKQFYLVNGKQVSAEEAIIAGLRGSEAFQCKAVEAKVSKSGTSIGVRAVKKPRAAVTN